MFKYLIILIVIMGVYWFITQILNKEKTDKYKEKFDIKKINAYINELQYKYGLFLKLYKNPKETLKNLDWYPKNNFL